MEHLICTLFPVATINDFNVDCDAPVYLITMCDTSLERSYNVDYKITKIYKNIETFTNNGHIISMKLQ